MACLSHASITLIAFFGVPLERLGNLLLEWLLFLGAVNRLLNLFSDVALLIATCGSLTRRFFSMAAARQADSSDSTAKTFTSGRTYFT